MPIIPRYNQQTDPNQPPQWNVGASLIQGLMAGSQAQRAQAEAEWRKATAERYKQQYIKLAAVQKVPSWAGVLSTW